MAYFNYNMKKPAIIFDTTIREGMQTPGGIGASLDEKIYAANLISRYADWIELGMPANPADRKDIAAIVDSLKKNQRDVGVAVLCRNNHYDIDQAVATIGHYQRSMAHLFIGTSDEHRSNRFDGKWKVEDYEKNIEDSVRYAASKSFERVMFSPEDAYRTFNENPEFFFRFVDAAINGYEEGSKSVGRKSKLILNFPDTVGASTIDEFKGMISKIKERYSDKIEISVHGHNDSSASNQQAIMCYFDGTVDVIQTTFGMLGERNGIAQTEAVIAMLNERGALDKKKYNDKMLKELVPATYAILGALGKTVPDVAQVSGRRTNVSVAGIHTEIAKNDNNTYHCYGTRYGALPELEFSVTSGAGQIIPVLQKIGIVKDKKDPAIADFVNKMKEVCNAEKRMLCETDVMYAAIHYFGNMEDPMIIEDYSVVIHRNKPVEVNVIGTYKGRKFSIEREQAGTLEAFIAGFNQVINSGNGKSLKLVNFIPEVRPRIPQEYLTWEAGSYPKVPRGLNLESDMQVSTAIKNSCPTNGDRIYYGFAKAEDSVKPIIESAIDAIVKMCAIEKWNDIVCML
jgi:2-isopropylmalate synthase